MRKKSLTWRIALMLLCCLAISASAMTAYAQPPDEADGYNFDPQLDKVFEDFDRYDISDTVVLNGAKDSGPSYISVPLSVSTSTPTDAIYKQGCPDTESYAKASYVVLVMRSPDGVTLSDIAYGARGPAAVDKDEMVAIVGFNDLEPGSDDFPELSKSWQKYIIDLDATYSDKFYPNSANPANPNDDGVAVDPAKMQAMHIMSVGDEAYGKHIEISAVYLTTDATDSTPKARIHLNNFQGSGDVNATAKLTLPSNYWAGSPGTLIKRSVSLTKDTSVDVVKGLSPTSGYAWAVVEVEGDKDNLSIALTNSTLVIDESHEFGAATAHAAGLAIQDGTTGFRLSYSGTDNVKIKRIYLTNFIVREVETEYPVLDSNSIFMLDDFSVEQKHILPYDESTGNQPTALIDSCAIAGRFGNEVDGYVYVENGMLVMDTQNVAFRAIDFDIKATGQVRPDQYKYFVLKVKTTNNAGLESLRFNFNGSDYSWFNGMVYSAFGLPAATLNQADYPYVSNGWTYLIVDIQETLGTLSSKISNASFYYGGDGKLLVDEMFFANEINPGVSAERIMPTAQAEISVELDEGENYQYLGHINAINTKNYPYLVMKMKGLASNSNLSKFRLEMGEGTFWAVANEGGTLLDNYGRVWQPLSTESQLFVIDLDKTGAGRAINGIHMHGEGSASMGKGLVVEEVYFADTQVNYMPSESKVAKVEYSVISQLGDEGYYYVGGTALNNSNNYPYLVFKMKGVSEDSKLSGLRLELGAGTYWAESNPQGILLDNYGALWPSLSTESQLFVIDLDRTGIARDVGYMHIHSGGLEMMGDDLIIEEIFFADYNYNYPVGDTVKLELTDLDGDYKYGGYVELSSGMMRYLKIEVEGSDDAVTLEGFRFQFAKGENNGPTKWFASNNEGSLIKFGGGNLSGLDVGSGKAVYYIDLFKTFGSDAYRYFDGFHVHTNGAATGGNVTLNFTTYDYRTVLYDEVVHELTGQATSFDSTAPVITFNNAAKAKAGSVTINTTIDDADTSPIVRYFVRYKATQDGAETTVSLAGKTFQVTAAGYYTISVYVIDAAGNESVDSFIIIADVVAPVVNITAPDSAEVGEEVIFGYNATDATDDTSKISFTVEVKHNGTKVTVTDNKFVVNEAGEYSITVTAVDESGNSTEKTHIITVKGASVNNSTLWIVLGTVGGVCVAGAGLAAYFVFKKRSNKA